MADSQDLNQELTPQEQIQPTATPPAAPAVFTQPDAPLAPALSPAPAPALPSTPEAQEETDAAMAWEEEVNKKKQQLEGAGRDRRDVSFQEAQQALIQEKELEKTREQEAAAAAQAELAEQEQAELAKMNVELDAYEQAKQKAQELNLPFAEDESKENLLAERTKELEIDTASTSENAQDIADAINANEEEVKSEIRNKREVNKEIRAAQIANAEQQQQEEQQNQVASQKAEENAIKVEQDLEEFEGGIFGGMTTSNKVLAAISIALSGIGQGLMGGRGSNQALQILQTAANERAANYRKKKELDFKAEQAAKEAFYKQARLKLDERKSRISDTKQLAEIEKLNAELGLLQADARNKAITAQLVEEGKQLPVEMLSKEDRERAVLINGKPRLAINKQAANELRKFKNDVEPAQQAIKRVLHLSKQGSRLSLEDRARIATEMQGIVGNLRLSFLGPGAMTESEYERLRSTLGNPNAFFALPSIERKKLETVFGKIQTDLNARYKNAGLDAPTSKREQLIQQQLKTGKSRADIEKGINALIDQGKLSQDYTL